MPPSVKISKELILNSSVELLKEKGIDAINARNIAKEIGCSTQPIFSVYENMSNLVEDVLNHIETYFYQYLKQVKYDDNFFLNIGLSYIRFSKEYPNFFRALFLLDNFKSLTLVEFVDSPKMQFLKEGIEKLLNIDDSTATKLFLDMWLYSHGIACMISTNSITLSDYEIEEMLTNVFYSFMKHNELNGGKL